MTAQSYERKVGDSHGLKKAYLGFQLGRVLEKEGKYCKKADRVFTFNQKDKRLIEEKYHVQNCQVLNPYYGIEDDVVGNDVAESRMTKSKGIKAADPETGTQPYTLCFLGQMGRDENYQAAMRLITIYLCMERCVEKAWRTGWHQGTSELWRPAGGCMFRYIERHASLNQ